MKIFLKFLLLFLLVGPVAAQASGGGSDVPPGVESAFDAAVQAVQSVGGFGLVVCAAWLAFRIAKRGLDEFGTGGRITPEDAEEMHYADGWHGPLGPDPSDASDWRNYESDPWGRGLEDEEDEDDWADPGDQGTQAEDIGEERQADGKCPACGSEAVTTGIRHPEGDNGCDECGEIWES